MIRFSAGTARFIRATIFEHGRDYQRDLWRLWLADQSPLISNEDPRDDGQGPMPVDLQAALLGCLYAEASRLYRIAFDPATSEDDAADASNDLAYPLGMIKQIAEQPNALTISDIHDCQDEAVRPAADHVT